MMKLTPTKIFASAIFLLLISFNGYAKPDNQKQRGQGPGPDRVQHLTEALQLDESQSAQLEEIMSAAHEQHQALSREDQEAHCAIQDEVDLQLVAILNADQIVSLEELINDRESRPKKRGGPGPQNCE